MRAIWSGSISFGLINVPVKLYSASEEREISFHLLHKTDLSPIRYARICKAEDKEIPYDEVVKGYEYEKGEYVVFDEKDFANVSVKKTGAIDIVIFTKSELIDAIYFERPYYLEPDKGAAKPYALLREALKASKTVAVVKYVFRNKEHLGIVKPYKDALILEQMRYATEIREMDDLKLPEKNLITKKEIEMALQLVDQLTETFDPKAYKDEYTHELQQAIEAKIQGIPVSKKGKITRTSKIHDLTQLLEQSLQGSKKKKTHRKAG